MPTHPKILRAGERAGWLFLCGLCYANEHTTDGKIARHVLPVAAPGVKHAERLAASLVAAGLWREIEEGWQIHDYTDYQRTAVQIREQRSRDAKRKADSRSASGGSPRGHFTDSGADSEQSPPVEERRGEKRTSLLPFPNGGSRNAVG